MGQLQPRRRQHPAQYRSGASKPRECLEYIVVHEMAHLLEPTHNSRFAALMDRFMPTWRFQREVLNRLPVRHESWGY